MGVGRVRKLGLVVTLALALQGYLGALFTSAGMVFVLLAMWLGARQDRKDKAPQGKE